MSLVDRNAVLNDELNTIQMSPLVFDAELSKDVVGIDFGTSHCSVAVQRRDGIETVAIENEGGRLMPSYVSFDEEIEKCGLIVLNRLRHKAASTVFDIKRIMGKHYHYIVKDPLWPFKVCEQNGSVSIQIQSHNGIIEKTPEEISAILLKTLKRKAEEYQCKELTAVTIAVPNTTTELQCQATIIAAKLAGWKVVNLCCETSAAALAYIMKAGFMKNSKILLIDLGGGTLDTGNECLGGRNFDNELFNYLSGIMETNYKVDLSTNKAKYRLMADCLEIKHTLSTESEACIHITDYNSELDSIIQITRKTFEKISQHLLINFKFTVLKALEMSKFTCDDIEMVIQVGGGCRMPVIKEILSELFLKSEHYSDGHLEEVVAIGAAYYAALSQINKLHLLPPRILTPTQIDSKNTEDNSIHNTVERKYGCYDIFRKFCISILFGLSSVNLPMPFIPLFLIPWLKYEGDGNQTITIGLIFGCSIYNKNTTDHFGINYSCNSVKTPDWFKACQGLMFSSAIIVLFAAFLILTLFFKRRHLLYNDRFIIPTSILQIIAFITENLAVVLTGIMVNQWQPFPNFRHIGNIWMYILLFSFGFYTAIIIFFNLLCVVNGRWENFVNKYGTFHICMYGFMIRHRGTYMEWSFWKRERS